MDFEDCPCSGRTLARLVQPAVMALLTRRPLHGYRIVKGLSAMAMFRGHAPDPTGVYRMLRLMQEDGLVVSNWDLGDTGPARRLFQLTDDGRACLRRWAQTLDGYQKAVRDLLRAIGRSVRIGKGDAPCKPGRA